MLFYQKFTTLHTHVTILMMIYTPNKLTKDEFGRVSGILLVNKPVGITSHDVVYKARKALHTPHVGHAGALDPFANGLILVLVGKATKLSNEYLNLGKEYLGTVLFGVSTNSADPEGDVLKTQNSVEFSESELKETLRKFVPAYEQYVPVFSSVKVDGEKLRVLARKSDQFEIQDSAAGRQAIFHIGEKVKTVNIPSHNCQISLLELLELTKVNISDSEFYKTQQAKLSETIYSAAKIHVACSKGTYIRALAEDIGAKLPTPAPAMLWELTRSKLGDFSLEDALSVEDLNNLQY